MSDFKPVLGLDFGTTNTAAAWFDEGGELHLVPVRDGVYTMPSVVCFHGGGSVLVGEAARQLMADVPLNTLSGVKRLIGRRFMSDFVGRHRGRFPFHLVEGEEGAVAAEIRGDTVALDEVAGIIIARIVELAEIDAGLKFESCVVAVPAHFTHKQRKVIRTAVAHAGLTVHAMVNEPTAAALYHTRTHQTDAETILVYDLGGGTFDTTLLRVRRGLAEVLATGGEAFLGGADFDARVIDELMERFHNESGVDLRQDMVVQQRLLFAAELAKIALSEETTARVRVPCVAVEDERFIDLDVELTRTQLEAICAPLIERTIGITLQVIGNAGLQPEQLDEVVLVGGQTKMPAIARRLGEVLKIRGGTTPEAGATFARQIDADMGVAIGAATFGHGVQVLIDVNAIPVGVMLPGQGPHEAIRQNTPLPCVRRVPLTRPASGAALPMLVYESVDATSIDRDVLGRLVVDSAWLDANPGALSLEVRMNADFELGFAVHAKEGGTKKLPLQSLSVPVPTAAPPPAAAPVRAEVRQPHSVGVTLALPSGKLSVRTENLSKGGMFIATTTQVPVGTVVSCLLDLEATTVELRARVVHVLDEETASTIGQVAGLGLSFIDPTPDQVGRILGDIDQRRASADVGVAAPAAGPADQIGRFVQGAGKQAFYAALGLEPLASSEEVRTTLRELKVLLMKTQKTSDEAVREKLERVIRIVDRVSQVLCEPRRRLEHDFQQGHVFASERYASAARGDGPPLALLREAWRKVYPAQVSQAGMLVARSLKAAKEQDLSGAIDAGEKALALDPFDDETRSKVEAWRRSLA